MRYYVCYVCICESMQIIFSSKLGHEKLLEMHICGEHSWWAAGMTIVYNIKTLKIIIFILIIIFNRKSVLPPGELLLCWTPTDLFI